MDPARERHWQHGVGRAAARARPAGDRGREKFYALVAYPGSSGFLHLGHLRGLTLADAPAPLPPGDRATPVLPDRDPRLGTPFRHVRPEGRASATRTRRAARAERGSASEWPRLDGPDRGGAVPRHDRTSRSCRRMGLLVDERAYVTTIDDDYQRVHRLAVPSAPGARRPRPGPRTSPRSARSAARSPSTRRRRTSRPAGMRRLWSYTTVPFRLEDGRVLLAATLRPETVYGVTNLWLPVRRPSRSGTTAGELSSCTARRRAARGAARRPDRPCGRRRRSSSAVGEGARSPGRPCRSWRARWWTRRSAPAS